MGRFLSATSPTVKLWALTSARAGEVARGNSLLSDGHEGDRRDGPQPRWDLTPWSGSAVDRHLERSPPSL